MAYAANEGLVLIRADGSVTLATAQSFSREQWLALAPRDIIAGQAGGVYSLFYEIIDEFGDGRPDHVSTLEVQCAGGQIDLSQLEPRQDDPVVIGGKRPLLQELRRLLASFRCIPRQHPLIEEFPGL